MKILRMKASFGTLRQEELILQDGLNVITRPNEAGKSTWSAFLLAMLYGIDTSQRGKAGLQPDKTRYRPWSGGNMEGQMEILWQGRRVILERTGTAKAPMSVFRAYDADTGLPIDALTGENCGEMLTGVERSVFERSAFMRQAALTVSSDAALDRRLSDLVTTGEETVSLGDALRRLHEMKNRLRHNKTGKIPELQQELAAVTEALAGIHAIREAELLLRDRQEKLTDRRCELEQILAALNAIEQKKKLQQKTLAVQTLEQALENEKKQRALTVSLPAQEVLQELQRQLVSAENTVLPPLPSQAPEKPDCPAVFSGLNEDEILPKAQADAKEYSRLTEGKPAPWPLWLILLGLAAAGLTVMVLLKKSILVCALLGLPVLACAAFLITSLVHNAKLHRDLASAFLLRQAYQAGDRDDFVPFAAQYHTAHLVWKQQCAQVQWELEQYLLQKSALEKRTARLIGSVSMFSPQTEDLPGVRLALSQAQAQYAACEKAALQTENARAQLALLSQTLGDTAAVTVPDGDWSGYDLAEVQSELDLVRDELAQIRSRLDLSRGRAEGFGDPAKLYAQKEALEKSIAELQTRYIALELAEQAMQKAGSELETRFAPQLARLAGSIFADLTGQRYDRILLDRDFRLEAGQSGETAMHQLLTLSGGTADQLYLAVRLSLCRLILGPEAPLVLDDALVMFDDTRMARALKVLKKESETRQILLFSCQKRESDAWNTIC